MPSVNIVVPSKDEFRVADLQVVRNVAGTPLLFAAWFDRDRISADFTRNATLKLLALHPAGGNRWIQLAYASWYGWGSLNYVTVPIHFNTVLSLGIDAEQKIVGEAIQAHLYVND